MEEVCEISTTRIQDTIYNDDDDDRIISLGPQPFVDRIISCILISNVRVENVISDVRVESMSTDIPLRRTFISDDLQTAVSASELSERWCIGLAQATNTIHVTTQNGVRSEILPLLS